ncbi:MAG: InlB B-repeat-containing protein, partial [Firmicutes bacterium]|nr:InlB B-repeat-containing protein [Bacillota bacterium]
GTSTITLASASRTGYRFDGWWTGLEGGTQITQIDEGSFGDLTVYARWSIDFSDDETGITVGQGPGGEIVVTVPGDPGTVITINPDNNPAVTIVPPNGDIIVDGPSQDGEITITIPGDYDDEETIIIVRPGEDPPVTVIPPAVRFTVTFDSLGGTPVNFQRIIQGEQAVKPTSTRTLYRLLGWSHNGEIFNFATSITEAKTLYAVWERINIDDGDTGIVVNPGDDGEIVITIPGEGGEEDTIIIIRPDPDNDEEHKVIITPPSGDITVEDDGDGKITITIPGEGDEEEVIIIVRPDEDPPVIIYPPVIRFTVVFDPLGGTAVPSQRVIKGEQATRSTSTRMLYRLLGWSHDGEVFDFETPITQAKTLSAIWQRIDIDTGDTGIIIQPGDEDDNDLPGDNDDIVIIIPGAPDTIIIVRPEDSDPVNIYPPNDDIVVEDDDDKEITITIPGNYDDEYVIITVRPDEDPPVTIQESTPHFTISFNSECEIEIPSQRVVINMPAVMPTPTRTLHRLVGWSTQENGENREIFDFSTPITSAQAFHAVWERILIDDGGTGIIVKPGDSEDGENPGQDDDIVIIIPDDDEAIVIIIRPDPENDGEYKVVISPPNADIEVEGGEDGEIIITVPGEDDGGCTVIIVRPGEDPPVVIIPPNTDTNQGGDDNGNFFTNNWPWFVAGFCIISLLILIGWIIHKSRRKNNSNL